MKKSRNNRGITLIALIITIIVMMILVGVTINIALNGGLFDIAKTAARSTEKEQEKEILQSAVVGSYNEETSSIDVEKLKKYLPEGWEVERGINSHKCTSPKGNQYTVNADGTIQENNMDEEIEEIATINDWTYTLDEETKIVTLTDYVGTNPDVYVPAKFTVNNVQYDTMLLVDRTTQKSPFSDNNNIYSVTFENGVKTNEMSYMFKSCRELRYVSNYPFYSGVYWIGVFANCYNLLSAPQIPNDIENIRITSFYDGCKKLAGNYDMPDSYNSNYGGDVFKDCENINKTKKIVWFGDSIAAGTTTSGISFVTYLNSDLADTGISNYAVGGHTLSYGYDNKEDEIAASIINDISKFGCHENIDYVFVSAGTNDFAHRSSRMPLGTYRFADIGNYDDKSPNTVAGAINVIKRNVSEKFPNAILVFTTPITRDRYDVAGATASDGSTYTVYLKDYVDGIKAACTYNEISYIDAYTESGLEVTNDTCDGTQNYGTDKTHPTLAGQKVLEEYILGRLLSDYGFSAQN